MKYLLVVVALGAFILGGLVGWGIKGNPPTNNLPQVGVGGGPGANLPTSDQIILNNLLMQHATLTTLYLEEIYDKKDTTVSSEQLQNNTRQIVTFFTNRYGASTKDQLTSMWRNHITEYANYTNALKKNDTASMNVFRKSLSDISQAMGTFFSKYNANFSSAQVATLMQDHAGLTLSIIDAYAHKDSATMIRQIKAESDQMAQFAAYLTQANSPTSSY